MEAKINHGVDTFEDFENGSRYCEPRDDGEIRALMPGNTSKTTSTLVELSLPDYSTKFAKNVSAYRFPNSLCDSELK
jgi:hypothetical protein